MSGFLSPENTFFRIMTKVCHIFFLNVLWLISSIPIITIGASTVAMHSVILQMVRDEEGYITRSYLKAFKAGWKRATILWFILLGSLLVIGGDILFFASMRNWPGTIVAGLFFTVLLILGLSAMLVFHHQAWFGQSVKDTLLHSAPIVFKYLPYSMALLILFLIMCYAFYVSVAMMVLITFFGVAVFSYISSYLWRRVFDKVNV